MAVTDHLLPALMFFNEDEARTVEAITARIIPGDANNPGAKEAGAVIFIDRALAGFFGHLQTFYREGLATLDHSSRSRFGSAFVDLTESQQDEFLRTIEGGLEQRSIEDALRDERSGKLAQFFSVVYEHTLEGTFGDPIYGGNREAVGWKMVGFPGAQWRYTAEQMKPGYDATQMRIATLNELRTSIKMPSERGTKE